MTPGKLYACSEAEYRGFPAANYSTLKMGRESALAMRYAIDHPRESSDAMELGKVVEALVFGDATWAVAPDVDRRTKAGKAEWADFQAANVGKAIVDAETMGTAAIMSARIKANTDAARLTVGAKHRQVVAVWDEPTTGVRCKARIDAMQPGVCLTDLKTTRAALDPRAFGREIAAMGYHIQAAFYADGFQACTGIETPFTLVVVQNRAPFDCAVYRLDDAAIDAGRKWYRHLLGVWKHGHATGEWPGVPAGISTLEVPAWEIAAADRAAWSPDLTDDAHPF